MWGKGYVFLISVLLFFVSFYFGFIIFVGFCWFLFLVFVFVRFYFLKKKKYIEKNKKMKFGCVIES